MITLYGINNCDTVRKAKRWLDEQNIDYVFHDLRKSPLDLKAWSKIIKNTDQDALLNRRGTTWRKLSDQEKEVSTPQMVADLLLQYPAIMKRPLLVKDNQYHIGFKPDMYERIF